MVRGCEVLRRILLLRVGLEDIAVGADVALLITVDVTILVPPVVLGEERGRGATPFFLFKAASSFWCLAIICACPAASISGAANNAEAVVAMALE